MASFDAAALRLLRSGAIPLLCGSATGCLALYCAKVASAAHQWRRLELPAFDSARCTAHAAALDEHSRGCMILTLTAAATTIESARDYYVYRSASLESLGTFFASRLPFFARPTVIGTAGASLLVTLGLGGGFRFIAPQRPPLLRVQDARPQGV
jgi:hypothetical protein